MSERIRVTIWNEGRHEKSDPQVAAVYPQGIHTVLAEMLATAGFEVRTVTLDEPDNGLPETVLQATDVLIWWGHMAHHDVSEAVVERVYRRVLDGMGLIVLHSGHFSKIFIRLMGSSCDLKWRDTGEKERIWVVEPGHPIAAGLPPYFEIEPEEMYGERFDIPAPETLVLLSWFEGGEVFRSGCCFQRGLGKIFYFRPGHESFPTYYHPQVQRVIINAVHWAWPTPGSKPEFGWHAALES